MDSSKIQALMLATGADGEEFRDMVHSVHVWRCGGMSDAETRASLRKFMFHNDGTLADDFADLSLEWFPAQG